MSGFLETARMLRLHIGNGWTGDEIRCCGQWRTLEAHAEHMATALLATCPTTPVGSVK